MRLKNFEAGIAKTKRITSNKIFRSLSISLYFKKEEIKQALQKALNKVITDNMNSNPGPKNS